MFLLFLFPYYLQGLTEKHLGDVGTLDKPPPRLNC